MINKKELLHKLEDIFLVYQDYRPINLDEKNIFIDDKSIGVQYSLVIKKDELQIVFRGTDSLQDLVTDIKFWKKKIPYNNAESKIRVHTGFIDAYKDKGVRDTISEYINDSIKKVVIIGHSYGGALAVLCAVDLQYNFPAKNYEVVLFGCPRVGNRAFAKSYNNRILKTYRVENANDIVTKVPFGIMGYRHVGIKLHVGKPRRFWKFSVLNHSVHSYYEEIWNLI